MHNRTRVLLVVTEFWNAGTQRFTYEVDRALDKERFETAILCFHDLQTAPERADHYYSLHRKLGTGIRFRSEFAKTTWLQNSVDRLLKRPSGLKGFLAGFDAISFMGEYSYHGFEGIMSEDDKKRSVIHIMNSRFQAPYIYDRYDRSKHYLFSSGFNEDEIAMELEGFNDYEHCFMPLSLHIGRTEPPWTPVASGRKKIGIFTRITPTKPLEPFLIAFHELQERMPDAELHIFGHGDPETIGYSELSRKLGIQSNVHFRGHSDDMLTTALSEQLSLVWFHSFYGVPGGFAGFDICTLGIPQLFWNFTPDTSFRPDLAFPVFNGKEAFVNASVNVLEDEGHALDLSRIQFNTIKETRDISKHIHRLEGLYAKLSSKRG